MLHFLAAVALCLFIGERIVRYWSEWRWRRADRRYIRWLQGEDIRSGLPPWVTSHKTVREPEVIQPSPPTPPKSAPKAPPKPYDPEPWRKGCAVIPLWTMPR